MRRRSAALLEADEQAEYRLINVLAQVDKLLEDAEADFEKLDDANDKVRAARNELRKAVEGFS